MNKEAIEMLEDDFKALKFDFKIHITFQNLNY